VQNEDRFDPSLWQKKATQWHLNQFDTAEKVNRIGQQMSQSQSGHRANQPSLSGFWASQVSEPRLKREHAGTSVIVVFKASTNILYYIDI
jgi:hypothetical protein